MTFIIGPLDWPLGRSKGRAFLRESAFSLRESTSFYGIRFFLLTSILSRPQFVYSNVGDFKPWRLARLCKTCLVNICSTKVEYNTFKRVTNTRGLTLAEPKTSVSLERKFAAFQLEEQLKTCITE